MFIHIDTTLLLCTQDQEEISDECESCGGEADVYCTDCASSRCNVCSEQWHKHPKRKHHSLQV